MGETEHKQHSIWNWITKIKYCQSERTFSRSACKCTGIFYHWVSLGYSQEVLPMKRITVLHVALKKAFNFKLAENMAFIFYKITNLHPPLLSQIIKISLRNWRKHTITEELTKDILQLLSSVASMQFSIWNQLHKILYM